MKSSFPLNGKEFLFYEERYEEREKERISEVGREDFAHVGVVDAHYVNGFGG